MFRKGAFADTLSLFYIVSMNPLAVNTGSGLLQKMRNYLISKFARPVLTIRMNLKDTGSFFCRKNRFMFC